MDQEKIVLEETSKKNKKPKTVLIIVIVIGVLAFLALGYGVYYYLSDKPSFEGKDENKPNSNGENQNVGETNQTDEDLKPEKTYTYTIGDDGVLENTEGGEFQCFIEENPVILEITDFLVNDKSHRLQYYREISDNPSNEDNTKNITDKIILDGKEIYSADGTISSENYRLHTVNTYGEYFVLTIGGVCTGGPGASHWLLFNTNDGLIATLNDWYGPDLVQFENSGILVSYDIEVNRSETQQPIDLIINSTTYDFTKNPYTVNTETEIKSCATMTEEDQFHCSCGIGQCV